MVNGHQGSLRADTHHCCIYSAGWGIKMLFLNLGFWNLRLRCWSYLGLPLSSPVFPCPPAMFLSTTWSGTLQKMTGVTLVTLKCVQYEVLNSRIHLKMIHRVHADHMKPAESGSYNLEGVLCALAVPFLSAWIVIITRQVLIFCFQFLPSPASPLKLSGKACALFYPGVLVSSNAS